MFLPIHGGTARNRPIATIVPAEMVNAAAVSRRMPDPSSAASRRIQSASVRENHPHAIPPAIATGAVPSTR